MLFRSTGILAVELFETTDGRILVNELAMRPHNTGHWTQDGAVTSQFENHLRAVMDLPLGSPAPRARWTVMVNVLGGPTDAGHLYDGLPHAMARDPHLRVHLYGKDLRPGDYVFGWDEPHGPFEYPDGFEGFSVTMGEDLHHHWDPAELFSYRRQWAPETEEGRQGCAAFDRWLAEQAEQLRRSSSGA